MEFSESGEGRLRAESATEPLDDQQRIAFLEKKIQTKDKVLAELMASNVALKALGDL